MLSSNMIELSQKIDEATRLALSAGKAYTENKTLETSQAYSKALRIQAKAFLGFAGAMLATGQLVNAQAKLLESLEQPLEDKVRALDEHHRALLDMEASGGIA